MQKTMIERVAKALEASTGSWNDAARAAIEAMRAPTFDMMAEGVSQWVTHDDAEEDVDGIWSAMIDAALAP